MLTRIVLLIPYLFAVVFTQPATETIDGSGAAAAAVSDPDIDIVDPSLSDVLTNYENDDNEEEEEEEEEEKEEKESRYARREEALTKLQQILGMPGPADRSNAHKIPPQFMIELYNTIADPGGLTRGNNPYNAKVVRSFIERDSSMSNYYLFNISGLEMNESVLEAELHLYRKRTPLKAMSPTVLSSPYYLIRVYQVLDERQLDTPDLQRLLNVHYVGAHASGWQVFNVKQAVLSWVSGSANLGLLVTASNLFGDDAAVHFTRRNDYHDSKQPILVLFNDDGKPRRRGEERTRHAPNYYKHGNDLVDDETEAWDTLAVDSRDGEEPYRSFGARGRGKRASSRPGSVDVRIVSKERKITGGLTSMDIYELASTRENIFGGSSTNGGDSNPAATSSSSSNSLTIKRLSRSATAITNGRNVTECARAELYVDFEEIGWSNFIIAPIGYSAYHCKGHCNFPLSQSQHPTNHATVQSIVHVLRQGEDVSQPCCVPTKLMSSSFLYFDQGDNVVLKLYKDMVADRCGCH